MRSEAPPPTIAAERVLQYAILPKSIPFVQDKSLFIGLPGRRLRPLGRVPRLAIAESSSGEIRLLHCSDRWEPKAMTTHQTVAEARRRAERSYPGSSRRWLRSGVTKAAAARHLETLWGPLRCMFCHRTPLEHDGPIVSKAGARICGDCITEFYQDIRGRAVNRGRR